MPGSHSKKDKLKKKVRKARKTVVRDKTNEGYEPTKLKGKKRIPPSRVSPNWEVTKKSYPTSDYQRKVEYEQDKELGEDAVSVSESNAKKYSKLKKRIAKQLLGVEFGTLGPDGKVTNKGSIDLDKIDSDDPIAYSMGYSEGTQNTKINPKGVEISPGVYDDYAPEYKRGWSEGNLFFKKTLKKTKGKGKFSKVRKADQQDINRVKRWNSRSFNKKKELSGPTEPVFKTTEATNPLTARPHPGMVGDELVANLRNRLAKIENYNAEADPEASAGEWINKYRKKRKNKIAKVRKANGGIAPNYNNPSKVRKKKTATKTALRSAVNKGVNKVNVIKPTKTYKPKPPQGPNPHAETPEGIRKNAEVVGRKNDTYIGKRIARIRKATEQIDPRVKKRKTVRPDSPVQKVAIKKINTPHILDIGKHSAPMGRQRIPPSRVRPKSGDSDFTSVIKNRERKYKQHSKMPKYDPKKTLKKKPMSVGYRDPKEMSEGFTESYVNKYNLAQTKDRIAELKTAKDHSHSIAFRKHEGQYYRRASLTKQEGKYAKYWLLNAKQMNGNGWGVSPTSIAKNINKFIGRPFVITAKQWVPESEYGEQFEHPYLPTNNIDNIIHHQEKFRVGSIVDVVEKDGDYHAVIEMNSKFANMMLPPFCSPAIFQNNPGEADGEISDWEALHLAGLMEDPAYGARIALLKGSCMGTAEACSIQFKGAKLTKTMCPKKKAKLVRRLDRLGD